MRTTVVLLGSLFAAIATTAAFAAPVAAPPPPPDLPTTLDGTVTSSLSGLPLAGADVFISTTGGLEQTVVTDSEGHYRADLHNGTGTYDLVYVYGSARIGHHVFAQPSTAFHMDVEVDDSAEQIDINDHVQQWKVPAPLQDVRILPRYSDRAALGNYWAKAWMLLDINADGGVERVKFLKRPGYDLDDIAVETAFGLRFTPAIDGRGHPRRVQMPYPIEWPSMWWVINIEGVATRRPEAKFVARVPCLGSGPFDVMRDCSKADLSKADSEPWIAKP